MEKSPPKLNPTTPQKETESVKKKRGRSDEAVVSECTVDYEKCREGRIKENQMRLQKLMELSNGVKTAFDEMGPKRRAYNSSKKAVELGTLGPTRRSSRLQNVAPVSYVEVKVKKGDEKLNGDVDLIEEGRREEIYTEEHEKMLGSCEAPWTLFVDGYGKDGKRIYDPVRGKTCHQCRQKTMGHRTSCYKCQLVQGQFCGDCLFIRYGENVLEANKNPKWMCPACRGICNCSLCRLKKGWNPTGALYRKIASLGYKSVAHYLIQTRRASADSKESLLCEIEGNTIDHTEAATLNLVECGKNGNGEDVAAPVSSRLRKRQKA